MCYPVRMKASGWLVSFLLFVLVAHNATAGQASCSVASGKDRLASVSCQHQHEHSVDSVKHITTGHNTCAQDCHCLSGGCLSLANMTYQITVSPPLSSAVPEYRFAVTATSQKLLFRPPKLA